MIWILRLFLAVFFASLLTECSSRAVGGGVGPDYSFLALNYVSGTTKAKVALLFLPRLLTGISKLRSWSATGTYDRRRIYDGANNNKRVSPNGLASVDYDCAGLRENQDRVTK